MEHNELQLAINELPYHERELLSDGYHTYKELYDIRLAYNSALFNEWSSAGRYDVHKSRRHYDGTKCFVSDDWFIVSAKLPGGQISNHYHVKYWDLFNVPETEKCLHEWDGHNTQDVIHRLISLAETRTSKSDESKPKRHVVEALEMLFATHADAARFVTVTNSKDVHGVAPIVSFTVQSDPIKLVGVNGCQAQDMLEYVKNLFVSLNNRFPCRENALTITKLEEAIHWQEARTRDRIRRAVEGENKD